jgi:hypothetical protein
MPDRPISGTLEPHSYLVNDCVIDHLVVRVGLSPGLKGVCVRSGLSWGCGSRAVTVGNRRSQPIRWYGSECGRKRCLRRMERSTAERIHIALSPGAVLNLKTYSSLASKVSLSDTIRYLVRIALNGEVPPAHLNALRRMPAQQSALPPEAHTTLRVKSQRNLARIHITLSSNDLKDIKEFQNAARIGTQSEAIRYLVGLSLAGEFSREHLEIVHHLAVQDRARRIWEEDNRPEGKHEEHWLRAEAEIAAKEAAQKKEEATRLLSKPEDYFEKYAAKDLHRSAGETSDTPDESVAKPHWPFKPA